MTTAWFHCFSGVAGDMALGALIDAGAPIEEVTSILGRLGLPGWALEVEPVLRGGIGGTKVHVRIQESTVVRTASHIQGLVTDAELPARVESRALAVFGALATAEGRLHRRPPDQVHFHEVGGVDAIVDVVGTCAALEVLGVDEVTCSPVAVGHVAVGVEWFRFLCDRDGVDRSIEFERLVAEASLKLVPPFNHDARRRAGFDMDDLRRWEMVFTGTQRNA